MKQKISNELQDALKYNLSFAGCGFLGIYHGMISYDFFSITIFHVDFFSLKLVLRCVLKSTPLSCYLPKYQAPPQAH